jgi:hypothetical protein
MTAIMVSLALRMAAALVVGALSQRHALLGQWQKAVFLGGVFIALFRGGMLRAIELHILQKGYTPDLVGALHFLQAPRVTFAQDAIILVGALMCLHYYSYKAYLHGKTKAC